MSKATLTIERFNVVMMVPIDVMANTAHGDRPDVRVITALDRAATLSTSPFSERTHSFQ